MADIAIGFGIGFVFTILLFIPAVGFCTMQWRKHKRNVKRRKRSAASALPLSVDHPSRLAERNNSGESAGIRSVGNSSDSPSGQTRPQTPRGTHGSHRSTN